MSKPAAVPYCTVKGFRKCLQALRESPAKTLDRAALVARGISPHSAYPVLGALRFLGLVDADGVVLPTITAFLGDDVRARRALVDAAYADLLADVRFPIEDREVVDRLLVDKHGVAPGVAPFCATFFLWAAAEAGLPVAELGQAKRGRPPAHLTLVSEAARRAIAQALGGPPPRTDERLDLDGARVRENPAAAPTPPSGRPEHRRAN